MATLRHLMARGAVAAARQRSITTGGRAGIPMVADEDVWAREHDAATDQADEARFRAQVKRQAAVLAELGDAARWCDTTTRLAREAAMAVANDADALLTRHNPPLL